MHCKDRADVARIAPPGGMFTYIFSSSFHCCKNVLGKGNFAMALYTYDHDAPGIVAATRQWVERSLIADNSVFVDETIGTLENYNQLDRYYVQRPDEGSGSFYEKLESQLAPASPGARKLMAELLWALFLFPSNVSEHTKRESVVRVWGWSGEPLDPAHSLLADEVLDGVGSAGMGVNSNRWRELNFMVAIGQSLKAMDAARRRAVLTDYDGFMDWIESVPQEGDRQFRHMLRYLLFPERVERMSSNGDRRRVLEAFGVAPIKATRKWSDRQLDDAMAKLRSEQEQKFGTQDLDFYLDPLRSRWKRENDPDIEDDADEDDDAAAPAGVAESRSGYDTSARRALNLILYGPPGTGKTWRLKQHYFPQYTEKASDLDRAAWLQQVVARFGWRAVLAAALADTAGPVKGAELEAHELVAAKTRERQRTRNVLSTVVGNLQAHTALECTTVNVADKRPPYLFAKDAQAKWTLLRDWQEADPEAAELFGIWRAGQQQKGGADVRRYRVVTFHPSYSYEDFVIGLRPVVKEGAVAGSVTFRMVDGAFKQICAEARANPSKRYALFIDEINRANIAKVFGELITLVEGDKRARYDDAGQLVAGMEVQLPGTGGEDGDVEMFGVPENLDIIGTMNTADRSIALLDIALRRRFEFQEMVPDYTVIRRKVGTVDLESLLTRINDRIEYLADRDRVIGHAYFTRVSTLDDLRSVFRDQLIPLLQEYFFDDFSRIELVLSNSRGKSPFVSREQLDPAKLFAATSGPQTEERVRYRLSKPDTWTEEAFRSLYEADTG